jgi:hypothetical protein
MSVSVSQSGLRRYALKATSHMLYSTANSRIVQDIGNGAVNVGHRNIVFTIPGKEYFALFRKILRFGIGSRHSVGLDQAVVSRCIHSRQQSRQIRRHFLLFNSTSVCYYLQYI